jgi:plastocyanin
MKHLRTTLIVLLGLTWLLGAAPALAATTTTITVTAGKPSELSFKLSKTSPIAPGNVVFKVTNRGKSKHSFKICTHSSSGPANLACAGKATKVLAPGATESVKVALKLGTYSYFSTVKGEANAGMQGQIGVGITLPPVLPATPIKTGTSSATGAAAAATTCASPQSTTINVNEFDFAFTLSSSTVHCGKVTFVQTNTGSTTHNFAINGISGALIDTAQTTTFTTTLNPGTYRYICDVTEHAAQGMTGRLTVTG